MIRDWFLSVGKQLFLYYCGYGYYEPDELEAPARQTSPPTRPDSPPNGRTHTRKAG